MDSLPSLCASCLSDSHICFAENQSVFPCSPPGANIVWYHVSVIVSIGSVINENHLHTFYSRISPSCGQWEHLPSCLVSAEYVFSAHHIIY